MRNKNCYKIPVQSAEIKSVAVQVFLQTEKIVSQIDFMAGISYDKSEVQEVRVHLIWKGRRFYVISEKESRKEAGEKGI